MKIGPSIVGSKNFSGSVKLFQEWISIILLMLLQDRSCLESMLVSSIPSVPKVQDGYMVSTPGYGLRHLCGGSHDVVTLPTFSLRHCPGHHGMLDWRRARNTAKTTRLLLSAEP